MHSPWKTMEQSQLEDVILRHETAACSANWDQNTVLIFRETGPDGAVTVSSECQNVDIQLHLDSFTRLFDLDSQEQEMILTLSWEGCVDSSACFSTCTVSVRDEPEDMFSRILNKLCTEDFTSFRQLAKVLYREYRSRLMVLRGKPLSFDIVHMNLTEYEYLQDNISVLEKNFRNLFDGDKRYDFMFDLRMHIAGGDDFTLTYPEKGFVPGMELYTEQCMRNKSSLMPRKEDTQMSEVNSEEYISRLSVKYEDAPINNSRPLHFHDVHGLNIQVSPDRTRARRYRGFSEGICFTNRPVNINEKVCVKIMETTIRWNGAVRFGLTNIDPASHCKSRLPPFVMPDLVIKTGYWANPIGKEYTEMNNLLCFWVNPLGDVLYSVNGKDKGVFISGVMTNSPLWALLDIYGNTCSLEFVQVYEDTEDLTVMELEQHLKWLQSQRKRIYLEYCREKSQNKEMRNSVKALLNHQRKLDSTTPSTQYVEQNVKPPENSQITGNGAMSQLPVSETNTSKLSLLTGEDVEGEVHQSDRFMQQRTEKNNQGPTETDKKNIHIQDSDQNVQGPSSATQDILSTTKRAKSIPVSEDYVEDVALSISSASNVNNPYIPRLCHIRKCSSGRYGIVFTSNGDNTGYFVKEVVNGSPAHAADVRVGDRIIEVNGENTETCTLNDLCEKIDRGGDETRLLVVDKATDDYYKSHRKTLNSTVPEIKHTTGGKGDVLIPKAEGLDTVLCFHTSHRIGLLELQDMKKIATEFIDGVKDIADKCDIHENIGIVAFEGSTWIKHQPTNDYASVRANVDQLQLSGNISLDSSLQVSLEFIKEKGKPHWIGDVHETGPRLIVLTNENGNFETSVSEQERLLSVLLRIKEERIIKDSIVWIEAGHNNRAFLRMLATVTNDVYLERNDLKNLCGYQQMKVVTTKILMFKSDHQDSLSGNDELDLKFLLGMYAGHLDEERRGRLEMIIRGRMAMRGPLDDNVPLLFTEPPESPDLPPLGSRVVRGKDWMCANDDSDGPGTIIAFIDELPGFVAVEWDNGHTGKYRYGAFSAFDLKVVTDMPRVPDSDFVISVGCEVQRGPDWNDVHGNEDGGQGGFGVVISSSLDGLLTVRWHRNGYIGTYKCGQDDSLEVMMRDSTVSTQESCQPSDDDAPQIHTDTAQTSNSHHHTDENANETRPSRKAEDCWIWQWQDNKSYWWTYSEENSQKLERCFSCDPEGSCLIRRDKQSYRVLFKKMEEKCIGDNSRRKVQRSSNGTKNNKGQ